MSLTAGTLSKVSSSSTTANLAATAASGGTGPYTQQWYRSVTSGFTPGAGNIIAGATSLTLADSGLTPGTQYYYEVVYTDTGNGNATVNSTQLGVLSGQEVMSQNSFGMGPFLGMPDLKFNGNTVSMQVDVSQSGTLIAGQAVKIVASAGGVPKIVGCAANSDACIGFISYDIKSQSFQAGDKCEVAMAGNAIYLFATTAIPRFSQVTLDMTTVGGVGVKVGSSGASIVGYAFDQGVIGGLIRVMLSSPSFAVA